MATTTVKPTVPEGSELVEFKKRAFNLAKFERETLSGTMIFTPVKDLDEALIRLDNDDEKLVDGINQFLKRKEMLEAKSKLIDPSNPDIVASAKAIMQFAANFYAVAPYSAIKDKKKRKEAVFAFIKSNDALMAALRTIAAAVPATEDDDDDETEES